MAESMPNPDFFLDGTQPGVMQVISPSDGKAGFAEMETIETIEF